MHTRTRTSTQVVAQCSQNEHLRARQQEAELFVGKENARVKSDVGALQAELERLRAELAVASERLAKSSQLVRHTCDATLTLRLPLLLELKPHREHRAT